MLSVGGALMYVSADRTIIDQFDPGRESKNCLR